MITTSQQLQRRYHNEFAREIDPARIVPDMFRAASRYGDARARHATYRLGGEWDAETSGRMYWFAHGWYRLLLNRRGHDYLQRRMMDIAGRIQGVRP